MGGCISECVDFLNWLATPSVSNHDVTGQSIYDLGKFGLFCNLKVKRAQTMFCFGMNTAESFNMLFWIWMKTQPVNKRAKCILCAIFPRHRRKKSRIYKNNKDGAEKSNHTYIFIFNFHNYFAILNKSFTIFILDDVFHLLSWLRSMQLFNCILFIPKGFSC